MSISETPFSALSLIAAPAVLTNACSVLVLSTSNRLARAVDRTRGLSAKLDTDGDLLPFDLRELQVVEQRSIILLRALRMFYGALGGFASAAFVSVCGSVFSGRAPDGVVLALEVIALTAGIIAVTSLVTGAILLVRETRIAVGMLHEQAADIQEKVKRRETEKRQAEETRI